MATPQFGGGPLADDNRFSDLESAAYNQATDTLYSRNMRAIVVRINDRGPYANDRIIDLSRRSAELLGFRDNGTATVRVRYLGRAPLNGDDSYERRYLASQSWAQVASRELSEAGAREPLAVGSIAGDGRPQHPQHAAQVFVAAAGEDERIGLEVAVTGERHQHVRKDFQVLAAHRAGLHKVGFVTQATKP
mgnify:CR=1 FL=1